MELPDVQNDLDNRNIYIDKVGVRGIKYPLVVGTKKDMSPCPTVADINMYVGLSAEQKGTHMSRFVEVLEAFSETRFNLHYMKGILSTMTSRLEANVAFLEVSFPYFLSKKAPVSGLSGVVPYECSFSGSYTPLFDRDNSQYNPFIFKMTVKVPVTSLCPCSKEISEYGAHNQRSIISLTVEYTNHIWIEDIIQLLEECGSCEIYSLLKRPDEKAVTERAYENPKFVEDIIRSVALRVQRLDHVQSFHIACENHESIHNHSAYAEISTAYIRKGA